ncbi:unnamed protein product [Prorocentrum cordatum]|uniref:Uncharacterized protein n=1 Tax=Prorocentrum cordatum TaxID=2364126 RepID=A0ABN9WR81_9DINO|nr:unnamed protein product [Polarella glacialis]
MEFADKDSRAEEHGATWLAPLPPLPPTPIFGRAGLEINDPQSKIYGWEESRVAQALRNHASGRINAKRLSVWVFTLKDFGPWFINEVLAKVLPTLRRNGVLWIGKTKVGKSTASKTLAFLMSMLEIDALEGDDREGAPEPSVVTAKHFDFFKGEPVERVLPLGLASNWLPFFDCMVMCSQEYPHLKIVHELGKQHNVAGPWMEKFQDAAAPYIADKIPLPKLHEAFKKRAKADEVFLNKSKVSRLAPGTRPKKQEMVTNFDTLGLRKGMVVATDGWKATIATIRQIKDRDGWSDRDLKHDIVVHSKGEVKNQRGFTTNHIENRWSVLKRWLKKRLGGRLPTTSDRRKWARWVTEFQYRKNVTKTLSVDGGNTYSLPTKAFLSHVAEVTLAGGL